MDNLLTNVCELISCFSKDDINDVYVHNYIHEVEISLTEIEDDSKIFNTWSKQITTFINTVKMALFNGCLNDIKDYVLDQSKSYAVYTN